MTEQLITSDLIISGASGFIVGLGSGFAVKKVFKFFLKLIMVIGVIWVGSLIYLQSIRVINLNEKALDNLLNSTFNNVNDVMGYSDVNCLNNNSLSQIIDSSGNVINQECVNQITQPITSNLFNSLGVPLSGGLLTGFIIGWVKG